METTTTWSSTHLVFEDNLLSSGISSKWHSHVFCCTRADDSGGISSSEDSLGASVATSENLYKSRISAKPSTILALNHETVGMCTHILSFHFYTWLILALTQKLLRKCRVRPKE